MKGKTLYNGEWLDVKDVALKSGRHILTVYRQRMKIDGGYIFKTHVSPPLVVGNKVGMLTVLDELDPDQKRKSTCDLLVLCQCDCGVKKYVKYRNLYNLNSRSCGCKKKRKSNFTKEERESERFKSLSIKYVSIKNSFGSYYFNGKWKSRIDFVKFFLYNDEVDGMHIIKKNISLPMGPNNYMIVDNNEAKRLRKIDRLRRKLSYM